MAEAGEDRKQQIDREMGELLEELRVLIPGVQILAGFLLSVTFTSRYDHLTMLERGTHFASFLASMIAAALFLAPGAQHRLRWRQPDKGELLEHASRMTLAGTVFVAIGAVGTTFLVSEIAYSNAVAACSLAAIAGMIVVLWYAWPLWKRIQLGGYRPVPEDASASTRHRHGFGRAHHRGQ